jgi:hypothetical protein
MAPASASGSTFRSARLRRFFCVFMLYPSICYRLRAFDGFVVNEVRPKAVSVTRGARHTGNDVTIRFLDPTFVKLVR